MATISPEPAPPRDGLSKAAQRTIDDLIAAGARLVPVRPNLVRQARKASGMSPRQWKRWRKTQARRARTMEQGLTIRVPKRPR